MKRCRTASVWPQACALLLVAAVAASPLLPLCAAGASAFVSSTLPPAGRAGGGASCRVIRMGASGAAGGGKRAAVVGAGAAGLAAAKQLRQDGHSVRVFEMSQDVGGVWQYSAEAEDDPMGNPVEDRVHSSMYESLRTNLPREVMAFDALPFEDELDTRRFPHHSAVFRCGACNALLRRPAAPAAFTTRAHTQTHTHNGNARGAHPPPQRGYARQLSDSRN